MSGQKILNSFREVFAYSITNGRFNLILNVVSQVLQFTLQIFQCALQIRLFLVHTILHIDFRLFNLYSL